MSTKKVKDLLSDFEAFEWENETIDQLKVRLCMEMGNNPEEIEYGGFELSEDIGYLSLDQYVQLKGKCMKFLMI